MVRSDSRLGRRHPAAGAVIGVWTWTSRPYQPSSEALRWYERGVDALYSMTYETARKSLEQAVSVDPGFALAHASLARAYDELDYTDRAKDSMLRAVAAAQDRGSAEDDRKLRALQFMVSREYERAAPLVGRSKPRRLARTEPRPRSNRAGWPSRWKTPRPPPRHSVARSRSIRRTRRRNSVSASCSGGREARTNRPWRRSVKPKSSIEWRATSKA